MHARALLTRSRLKLAAGQAHREACVVRLLARAAFFPRLRLARVDRVEVDAWNWVHHPRGARRYHAFGHERRLKRRRLRAIDIAQLLLANELERRLLKARLCQRLGGRAQPILVAAAMVGTDAPGDLDDAACLPRDLWR
eukprot:6207898-Pleurochrysis_carterae.AAC.3